MNELQAVKRPIPKAQQKAAEQAAASRGRRTMQQGEQMRKAMGGATGKRAADPFLAKPSSYKKGGKVQKTGMALVHKGEKVLTKAQAKKAAKKK